MIRKYPAVMLLPHAHGHNDGCEPIVEHLRAKYVAAMLSGANVLTFDVNIADRIARSEAERRAETLILESPYPATSSHICALARIAPQSVSHVLLLTDANVFGLDPKGSRLSAIAAENGATALALGNVWGFDPESRGATTVEKLGNKTAGLVNYIEQFLRLPVVFIATSSETVIDRESVPIHKEYDPTQVARIGGA